MWFECVALGTREDTNLSGISEEVAKGINFLRNQLSKAIEKFKQNGDLSDLIGFVDSVYVLNKINDPNDPLVSTYLELLSDVGIDQYNFDVISIISDEPLCLYYLQRMGLSNVPGFIEVYKSMIKDSQMLTGYILSSSSFEHVAPMRVLVAVEPESDATKRAVTYFTDNVDRFSPGEIALGILALFELNYFQYSIFISEQIANLKAKSDQGYISSRYSEEPSVWDTALVIQAIASVCGFSDASVMKAAEWLKTCQNSDGGWGSTWVTSQALLALISAGEGRKVPYEELEKRLLLHEQQIKHIQPRFVATFPFQGDFSIKETIREMIYSETKKIWISSRFITEFWTDIVTMKRDKPDLDIRVVTIPLKEAKSKITGEGKKYVDIAYETLQRTLGSNMKATEYLHARFIVTDNALLVSSADLSTEQLEKEINAGLWTRDKQSIFKAAELYEKIWKSIT